MPERVVRITELFERAIVLILLALLMIVVAYATISLAAMLGVTMLEKLKHPEGELTMPLLHEVFSGFLMILIGLELMKTIVMYLDEHVIHVEVVMSVAMIAIARHAIDVDYTTVPALTMVGMGTIILALAVGYFYFKKADQLKPPDAL